MTSPMRDRRPSTTEIIEIMNLGMLYITESHGCVKST